MLKIIKITMCVVLLALLAAAPGCLSIGDTSPKPATEVNIGGSNGVTVDHDKR